MIGSARAVRVYSVACRLPTRRHLVGDLAEDPSKLMNVAHEEPPSASDGPAYQVKMGVTMM